MWRDAIKKQKKRWREKICCWSNDQQQQQWQHWQTRQHALIFPQHNCITGLRGPRRRAPLRKKSAALLRFLSLVTLTFDMCWHLADNVVVMKTLHDKNPNTVRYTQVPDVHINRDDHTLFRSCCTVFRRCFGCGCCSWCRAHFSHFPAHITLSSASTHETLWSHYIIVCCIQSSSYKTAPSPPSRLFEAASYTPFTRYNQLSNRIDNRFDNWLYRVNGALVLIFRCSQMLSTAIRQLA